VRLVQACGKRGGARIPQVASRRGPYASRADNVSAVHVPADLPVWWRTADLTNRHAERAVLDRLIQAVRDGESRSLVVHGEAGVGKTALLDYLAGHATGCRVVRAAGAQSEMELAFAGLHQLCAPMLGHVQHLPVPQRDALRTAFGLSAGPVPDRFLIGLAVLSLLSQVAEEQPLVCLLDDGQWLDQASARILTFVARRLGAESVGLVFADRAPGGDLAGLPEMAVEGLSSADSRALLAAALTGPIDARVRDQIVTETRGNPLALLELPRGLTPEQLAGGFGLPGALPLADNMEGNFQRRVGVLPDQTRRLLLLAAADPSGDPALVWRAAARLGIGPEAAGPAAESGLAEFGTRLWFRHPLVRSAVYQSASAQDRRQAHRALAEATDPKLDPDRRAWHRAQAATGPDETVAEELEQSASRAQARGGLTAAAAFLERATTLTLDPAQRAGRALAAAQAKSAAGAFHAASDLLDVAAAGPLSDLERARADLVRAQLAFVANRGTEAPPLLLRAAGRLALIDPGLSRATYLDALSAAIFTGRLASQGSGVLEVARAASTAPPPPQPPRAPDLMLDGLIAHYNAGYAAGVPMLRRALAAFSAGMSADEELHWLWLACVAAAIRVWDDDRWEALSARHVQLARDTGALSELPLALTSRAYVLLLAGELTAAASLTDEVQAVKEATGSGLAPYGAFGLAALRGDEAGALALIDAAIHEVTGRGEGVGITFAEWANATLNNGLGHYDRAAAAAQRACGYTDDLGSLNWATVELIEAAARTGLTEAAAAAYGRLEVMTSASDTDWALGIRARSRALLAEDETTERLYRESIARLARTRLRVDLARAHLLYGEWLRRERRPSEAREQLRTAHGMLEAMGVAAFAERANRELRAAGGTVRKRAAARREELTAQEGLIARLASDGLSNPEIGTRLFISAHTVQYHLRKVFAKLGITSRSQLSSVLPSDPAAPRQP
jgi:DNA-binding CsgD family transcriptional regulator